MSMFNETIYILVFRRFQMYYKINFQKFGLKLDIFSINHFLHFTENTLNHINILNVFG